MPGTPVVAVFDIGKTNKKLLLYDEQYQIVREESVQLKETVDEDGDACEDILRLGEWVRDALGKVGTSPEFDLKALNIAAYGASFVHLDGQGKLLTPLYDYMKPYPSDLKERFYQTYGGEERVSLQTASPVLGSLNSGMQIYRLKYQKPDLFTRVKYSFHLPQYISWLFTGQASSDITSIGCHTLLWDFTKQDYHDWVGAEGIATRLPPLKSSAGVVQVLREGQSVAVGTGLHDSSAALIPYLVHNTEPFILLSTGTWSISLNPFNHNSLTAAELKKDCLCYLDYQGNPVKASRLFAGHQHEAGVKQLADHFLVDPEYYKHVRYDPGIAMTLRSRQESLQYHEEIDSGGAIPGSRDPSHPKTYEEGYHQLVHELVTRQVESTNLVYGENSGVTRIFVDGGFSQNAVFMNLLASAYRDREVYAASVPHATSLGAAVSVHSHWNSKPLAANLIMLKKYS